MLLSGFRSGLSLKLEFTRKFPFLSEPGSVGLDPGLYELGPDLCLYELGPDPALYKLDLDLGSGGLEMYPGSDGLNPDLCSGSGPKFPRYSDSTQYVDLERNSDLASRNILLWTS